MRIKAEVFENKAKVFENKAEVFEQYAAQTSESFNPVCSSLRLSRSSKYMLRITKTRCTLFLLT
jgi:hypothetical protein